MGNTGILSLSRVELQFLHLFHSYVENLREILFVWYGRFQQVRSYRNEQLDNKKKSVTASHGGSACAAGRHKAQPKQSQAEIDIARELEELEMDMASA